MKRSVEADDLTCRNVYRPPMYSFPRKSLDPPRLDARHSLIGPFNLLR